MGEDVGNYIRKQNLERTLKSLSSEIKKRIIPKLISRSEKNLSHYDNIVWFFKETQFLNQNIPNDGNLDAYVNYIFTVADGLQEEETREKFLTQMKKKIREYNK